MRIISTFCIYVLFLYRFILCQEEGIGDECRTLEGIQGKCLLQTECTKNRLLARETYFEPCRFNYDGTPIICCADHKIAARQDDGKAQDPRISTRSGREEQNETQDENSDQNTGEIETRFFSGSRSNKFNNYNNKYNKPSQTSKYNLYQTPLYNLEANSNRNKPSNNYYYNTGNTYNSNSGSNNKKPNIGSINGHNSGYNKYEIDTNKNQITSLNKLENNADSLSFPSITNNRFPIRSGNQAPPIWSVSSEEPARPILETTTKKQAPIWGTTERYSTARQTAQYPTASPKRISEQKCDEYSRLVTSTISAVPLSLTPQVTSIRVNDCKDYATLIVGGTKATLGEFPHMAAVGFRNGNGAIKYNCGGTLISDQYVLTAAHCTQSSLGYPVRVRLGDLNLIKTDDGAQPEELNIAEVILYRDYKAPELYHDIALLRLGRRVSFSANIRPACLYTKNNFNVDKVTATGWGTTNYGDLPSNDLLKVELNIIDNVACGQLYGPDTKITRGITSNQMCAAELSGGKDTCQGDSGGPIEIREPGNRCIHRVVGITSFGVGCGLPNSPGIYTRVSSYVSWIENIVWKDSQ